jgi:hypothetical protein
MACAFVSGCIEDTKQEFTLNPDGSGKMLVESTFIPPSEALRDDEPSEETAVQEAVRDLLTRSDGIEAWSDVSFSELKDGSFFFRGTAYFPDLSRVKLHELGALRFSLQRDSANNLVLAEAGRPAAHSKWDLPGAGFESLNEPLTAESIRRDRRRFKASQPMLLAMFGNLKQELTFHVPGVVRRSSNFETGTPGALRVCFNGERTIHALEEMISDDKVMQSFSTNTPAQSELAAILVLNEKVYGERSTIQASIRPGNKPAFDYRAEVTAALKEFPAVARKVGLPDGTPFPTVPPNQAITARVTGIEWKFGTGREEYALNLAFQLPQPVRRAERVELESVQTVEGLNLLRDRRGPDVLNWACLEKDNTTVTFNARLKAPPLSSRGIARISGVLHCASMESVSWIELISGDLVPGAKGSRFGVTIDDVERPPGQPEKLILRSGADLEEYDSFRIEGSPGQFVNLEMEGNSQIDGVRLRTLVASRALPKRGKLLAEVRKDVPTLKFPFTISDLTLLGRPRTQN